MSEESVGQFSVNVIKELSEQLQQLHGYASVELMPVILHSIALHSAFDIAADIIGVLFCFLYVRYFGVKWLLPKVHKLENWDREFTIGATYVFLAVSTFLMFFFFASMVMNVCYAVSPETKLIYKLLLRKL